MLKKLRAHTLLLAVLAAVLLAVAVPTVTYAQIKDGLCSGAEIDVNKVGGTCTLTDDGSATVNGGIKTAINIISLLVGVASVIMVLVGGLKYVTSNGDAGSISSAKNTILYALVGLTVAVLAQVIVRYVLNRVNKAASPPTVP
jgi:cytochrome bd-type quinol oxidase subunit 2